MIDRLRLRCPVPPRRPVRSCGAAMSRPRRPGPAAPEERRDPEAFPETAPGTARASWAAALEPFVFDGPGLGAMDADRWESTVDWLVKVHD